MSADPHQKAPCMVIHGTVPLRCLQGAAVAQLLLEAAQREQSPATPGGIPTSSVQGNGSAPAQSTGPKIPSWQLPPHLRAAAQAPPQQAQQAADEGRLKLRALGLDTQQLQGADPVLLRKAAGALKVGC